jgi:hypothetical protein
LTRFSSAPSMGKSALLQRNKTLNNLLCVAHNVSGDATLGDILPFRPDEAKRGSAVTTPNFEDFQKCSKQQVDAVNAATASVAKGLQEIAAESSDYSKKTFAAGSAVVEKTLGAKSIETAIQIQTEYARSAYEGLVAQASKINEIYAKLAIEAFKPVETAFAEAQGE